VHRASHDTAAEQRSGHGREQQTEVIVIVIAIAMLSAALSHGFGERLARIAA
jgi:hypothetical protein